MPFTGFSVLSIILSAACIYCLNRSLSCLLYTSFRYKDLICYKEFYNDTLFVVTEKELQPRYIFDLGKYSIPIDCRMEACDGDWKTYNTIAAPYIRNQVIETDSLLFMPYNYWAGEKQRERQDVYKRQIV